MRKDDPQMKIKVFSIVFITFFIVLTCSAFLMYTQFRKVQDIDLNVLQDRLYTENTKILSWTMNSLDLDTLGDNPVPDSWAEIMVVDNESLLISSTTNREHTGLVMYKLPELLDQAKGIMDAIKTNTATTVRAHTYIVSVMPLENNRSLLGFKPVSWEQGLLEQQNSQIQNSFESTTILLIAFYAAGLFLTFLIALFLANNAVKPLQRMISSFEELSMGNFDAEIPKIKGKSFESLIESFFRLRTSLMMALERLGGK